MKSLASAAMLANPSASNDQSPSLTFKSVSRPVSAWKGEIPLSLDARTKRTVNQSINQST